jgi:hypothetical protein
VATARSSEVKLRHGHGEGAILLRFSPREFPALSDEEKQAEPLAESQLAPVGIDGIVDHAWNRPSLSCLLLTHYPYSGS